MEAKQNLKSNESLPVYEAEIIEDNSKDDIEKFASAKPVVNKATITQKIGKTIGAIAAIAGILSEIRQYLPYQPSNKNESQNNKRQRKHLRSRGSN